MAMVPKMLENIAIRSFEIYRQEDDLQIGYARTDLIDDQLPASGAYRERPSRVRDR
jgi:hypothetical protein